MAFFEPSSTFTDGDKNKKSTSKPLNDDVVKKYNTFRETANATTGKKATKAFEKAEKLREQYDFSNVKYEGAGFIKSY